MAITPDPAIIALSGAGGAIIATFFNGYISRLGQKDTVGVEFAKLSRDLSRDNQEVRALVAGQQLEIATLKDQVADLIRERDGANSALSHCEDSRITLIREVGELRLELFKTEGDYEAAMYIIEGQAGGYSDAAMQKASDTIQQSVERRKRRESEQVKLL